MPPVATTRAAHARNTAESTRRSRRTRRIVLQFRPSVIRLRGYAASGGTGPPSPKGFGGTGPLPALEVAVNRRYLAPWTFLLAVAFALVPLSVQRLGGQA